MEQQREIPQFYLRVTAVSKMRQPFLGMKVAVLNPYRFASFL
jgi:hypothetical protein